MHGHDHLDVAKTEENMAIIYDEQGKFEKALEIYRKVLETKIRVCGHEHPDVADTYSNIGLVYDSLGNTEMDKEMTTKAYHIYLEVLGPDHPKTQELKPYVDE